MDSRVSLTDIRSSENGNLTLFLAGDVMTGRGIDQIHPHSVDPVLYEPYVKNARQYIQFAEDKSGPIPSNISHQYIWGDGLAILDKIKPAYRIVNLETSITTNNDPWPGKAIHYRMHPENADILNIAGIDVCTLGNNHVLDWNRTGLKETLQVLESNNICYCGAGMDAESAASPVIFDTYDGRLLIFSYATPSAGTPQTWKAETNQAGVNHLNDIGKNGIEKVIQDVRSHKKKNDRVIISIHWGRNWGYVVPKLQRKFAHTLIDNGSADLIFGHSSHHPKQMEVYRNRLILYGCGDLINDYEGISGKDEYRGELTLMFFPTLKPSGALKSLIMAPMKLYRFQLTRACDEAVDWLNEKLNDVCKKFGSKLQKTDEGMLKLK